MGVKQKLNKLLYYSDIVVEKTSLNRVLIIFDMIFCQVFYSTAFSNYVDYEFWKLSRFSRRNIVSSSRMYKIDRWFNTENMRGIVDNKIGFLTHFDKYIGRDWIALTNGTKENIKKFISNKEKVIYKPEASMCGRGVAIYKKEELTDQLIDSLLQEGGVLEEVVEQHPVLAEINPTTLNCVRVNTVVDREGKVHIYSTSFKAGSGQKGVVVDGANAGGLWYHVDMDTGVIDTCGQDIHGKKYIYHPFTKKIILGTTIPMWSELLEMIKEAALLYPEARLIGWDVAVDIRKPIIIEANYIASPELYQIFDKDGKYHYLKKML